MESKIEKLNKKIEQFKAEVITKAKVIASLQNQNT